MRARRAASTRPLLLGAQLGRAPPFPLEARALRLVGAPALDEHQAALPHVAELGQHRRRPLPRRVELGAGLRVVGLGPGEGGRVAARLGEPQRTELLARRPLPVLELPEQVRAAGRALPRGGERRTVRVTPLARRAGRRQGGARRVLFPLERRERPRLLVRCGGRGRLGLLELRGRAKHARLLRPAPAAHGPGRLEQVAAERHHARTRAGATGQAGGVRHPLHEQRAAEELLHHDPVGGLGPDELGQRADRPALAGRGGRGAAAGPQQVERQQRHEAAAPLDVVQHAPARLGTVHHDVLGAAPERGGHGGLVVVGHAQQVGHRADHAVDARGESVARSLRVAATRLEGGALPVGGARPCEGLRRGAGVMAVGGGKALTGPLELLVGPARSLLRAARRGRERVHVIARLGAQGLEALRRLGAAPHEILAAGVEGRREALPLGHLASQLVDGASTFRRPQLRRADRAIGLLAGALELALARRQGRGVELRCAGRLERLQPVGLGARRRERARGALAPLVGRRQPLLGHAQVAAAQLGLRQRLTVAVLGGVARDPPGAEAVAPLAQRAAPLRQRLLERGLSFAQPGDLALQRLLARARRGEAEAQGLGRQTPRCARRRGPRRPATRSALRAPGSRPATGRGGGARSRGGPSSARGGSSCAPPRPPRPRTRAAWADRP